MSVLGLFENVTEDCREFLLLVMFGTGFDDWDTENFRWLTTTTL